VDLVPSFGAEGSSAAPSTEGTLLPTGTATTSANCFVPNWPLDPDFPVVLRLLVRLIVVLAELPLFLAVMVATWLPSTATVEAVKVVDVALAGTVTDAGIVRAERLELNVTMAPFVEARWLRFTVQVLEELGPRLVGLHDIEETSPGGTSATV